MKQTNVLLPLFIAVALSLASAANGQTLAYAQRIADLNPGSVGSFPSNLVVWKDALYFSAYTLSTGRELWMFDGANISLATNINDTADDIGFGVLEGNDSIPDWMTPFNGALYFSAFDPRRGGELWRYDGTNAFRAADVNGDANDTIKLMPNSSWPRELTVMGTNLYFAADSGAQIPNYELWRFNGAFASMVANIRPNIGSNFSSYPSGLTTFNGALYFMADDGANGYELWKHDGASTVLFTNINPGGAASSSWPKLFTEFKGQLFFAAYDDARGYELWRTDGTNTVMLADINPGGSSNPNHLTVFAHALYFQATDGISGYELWKCDGTNVTRAADINPLGDSYPKNLTVFGDRLYFAADDGIHGWEMWSFDGANAALVGEVNDSGDAYPELLTVCAGKLFFTATNAAAGYEVWQFDGHEIALAADINPGAGSSYPLFLGVFGDELYFSANDGSFSDWELWVIRSTDIRLTSIQVVGDDVRVHWSTVGGTTHVVQSATDPIGPYEDVSDPLVIPGSGPTTAEFTHVNALTVSDKRFYRIVVR